METVALWLLIVASRQVNGYNQISSHGPFQSQLACERAGDQVVEKWGRPYTSYLCVRDR